MEAALILLAAAAAALALAWARERRLRREDADRGRRDLAEQRFRREAELKEQSQRTAALFDRMVEGLIVRPELFLEFVARHDFARVCQQEQEDLERLVPEFDLQTLLAQFARTQVDFEYTKAHRAAIPGHTRSW